MQIKQLYQLLWFFARAVYIPAHSNSCDHLPEYLDTPVLDHEDSELDHPSYWRRCETNPQCVIHLKTDIVKSTTTRTLNLSLLYVTQCRIQFPSLRHALTSVCCRWDLLFMESFNIIDTRILTLKCAQNWCWRN